MNDVSLSPELRKELIAVLPRLRRFARSLARGDPDIGDDIAQSAIERALSGIGRFAPGSRLDSWMYKIAQNIWIDRMRVERSHGTAVSDEALQSVAGADGRRVTDAHLALAATRRAIEQLPDDQRSLVMMVLVDGLSYHDAAEAHSIPIGTVMSRIHRARATLEEKVFGA